MSTKIDSRKPAPAPRHAAGPQQTSAVARSTGNTGIVPSAKRRPVDSFESASPLGQRKPAGTKVGPAAKGKTQINTDFELPPSLEKYRKAIAKAGAKIAKLPTEELRTAAVDRASVKLSELWGVDVEDVRKGLFAAVTANRGNFNDWQEC